MSTHIIKGTVVLLIIMLITLLMAVPVLAAELRSGETIIIASGEEIDDDVYITGNNITVNGTINGDLIVAGGTITINSTSGKRAISSSLRW